MVESSWPSDGSGCLHLGNLPSDGRRDPVGISKYQIVLQGAGKCLCSGATYWSCFRLSKFHLEMTYCTSPPIFAAENGADMSKCGNDPSQRGPICKQFSFDQKCPNFQDKFSANSRNNCGAVFISSYQFCLNSFYPCSLSHFSRFFLTTAWQRHGNTHCSAK